MIYREKRGVRRWSELVRRWSDAGRVLEGAQMGGSWDQHEVAQEQRLLWFPLKGKGFSRWCQRSRPEGCYFWALKKMDSGPVALPECPAEEALFRSLKSWEQ